MIYGAVTAVRSLHLMIQVSVSCRTFNSMDGAINNPIIMTHRLRKRVAAALELNADPDLVWWGKQAGLKPMARAH